MVVDGAEMGDKGCNCLLALTRVLGFVFQTEVKPEKPQPSACLITASAGCKSCRSPMVQLPLPSCSALEPTGAVLGAVQSKSAQCIAVLRHQTISKDRIEVC